MIYETRSKYHVCWSYLCCLTGSAGGCSSARLTGPEAISSLQSLHRLNPAPPPLSQLTAVTEQQCLWGSQVSNSAPLWKTSHLHQSLPLSLLFSVRVVACFSREFSALIIICTNRQGLRLGPEKVVSCYEGKTALWANLNLTEWGRAVAAEPPFSCDMHTCFSLFSHLQMIYIRYERPQREPFSLGWCSLRLYACNAHFRAWCLLVRALAFTDLKGR